MNTFQMQQENYLEYCQFQKRLDFKTLKAYKIDLTHFFSKIPADNLSVITPSILENYIACLHQVYKPKTVKRKIATLKAFFHYLEYRDLIEKSPFNKVRIKFREPAVLPKTIPLHTVESFLRVIYSQQDESKTNFQRLNAIRDAAVIETLFATGMRI